MESFVDISLWIAMGMVAVAALAAIIMPIINSLSHPKVLIKSAIAIVAIVVLFVICWAIAGDEVSKRFVEDGLTPSISKFAGGMLMTMYALFAFAIIGIIFSEINKALK